LNQLLKAAALPRFSRARGEPRRHCLLIRGGGARRRRFFAFSVFRRRLGGYGDGYSRPF
jgi:hypothetical protein